MNSENSEKFRKKEDNKDVSEVKEKYVKKEEVKDDEGLDKKDRKYYKVTIILKYFYVINILYIFIYFWNVPNRKEKTKLEFNRKCNLNKRILISGYKYFLIKLLMLKNLCVTLL